MEIHFYTDITNEAREGMCFDITSTRKAIDDLNPYIKTTQTSLISRFIERDYIKKQGYKVFLHTGNLTIEY